MRSCTHVAENTHSSPPHACSLYVAWTTSLSEVQSLHCDACITNCNSTDAKHIGVITSYHETKCMPWFLHIYYYSTRRYNSKHLSGMHHITHALVPPSMLHFLCITCIIYYLSVHFKNAFSAHAKRTRDCRVKSEVHVTTRVQCVHRARAQNARSLACAILARLEPSGKMALSLCLSWSA